MKRHRLVKGIHDGSAGESRTKQSPAMRAGFTLVELLVVVAIVAILASILLPALTRAREEAKRLKCMSNLKQLGIAFALFEADQGHPPGSGAPGMVNGSTCDAVRTNEDGESYQSEGGSPAIGSEQRASWAYQLFPHIQEGNLWNNRDDDAVAEVNVELLQCPSEGKRGGLDYRANVGCIDLSSGLPQPSQIDPTLTGAVAINYGPGTGGACSVSINNAESSLDFIQTQSGDSFTILLAEKLLDSTRDGSVLPGLFSTNAGGKVVDVTVFTVLPGYGPDATSQTQQPTLGAGPLHGLLGNVLFADGHVASVRNSIDKQIWQAMGTYQDTVSIETRGSKYTVVGSPSGPHASSSGSGGGLSGTDNPRR